LDTLLLGKVQINAVQPTQALDGEKVLLKSGIYFSKTRLKYGTIFFKHIAEGIVEKLDLKSRRL
jgi:hypothetical protein